MTDSKGRRGGRRKGTGAKGGKGGSRLSGRGLTVRVKTAKGRTNASRRWLERQLNDPFVAEAQRRGLRSRAAFKLLQLMEKASLFRPGARVVDLGAAPGGWLQVAVEAVGPSGRVVGVDVTEIEPVAGAVLIQGDVTAAAVQREVAALLGGAADVVLSDMAAPATGHAATDHLRVMALAEEAYAFAREVLAPDGAFVAKVFQGGTERTLLDVLKRDFAQVRHIKPPASRKESAEVYVVATGFRGADVEQEDGKRPDGQGPA